MILWLTALLPFFMGGLIWWRGGRLKPDEASRRNPLGWAGAGAMLVLFSLAAAGAWTGGKSAVSWGGGLVLSLEMLPMVAVVSVMIPVIALPILIWAAAAEETAGLARLIGLLVAFTGAMELLVLASDLLLVAISWELLGFFSWALIAHHWNENETISAANYAFNATRLGGLGLWLAAGAALASAGDLHFQSLNAVARSPWGSWMAAGILAAAVSKSAQLIFAPWLFRAMEGPSSVSALLHSSTMVAAGAWLIIRLYEPLLSVPWFAPAALCVGLATALAGGFSAAFQTGAKKLLAASTSAQYGLMFAAVGAGYAAAGLAHLVAHAACKALLFLAAGTAIHRTGSHDLFAMRLGRKIPRIAAASWVGALSLAAIPPLGAAWSKEKIVAAAGHASPWLAVLVITAGVLSAWYAIRFQTLAYGRGETAENGAKHSGEAAGVWILAALSILLGLLWLAGKSGPVHHLLPGMLPEGKTWELILSVAAALGVAILSGALHRHSARTGEKKGVPSVIADLWGVPFAIDSILIRPVMMLSHSCAVFDRKVVDAGVEKTAAVAHFFSRSVASVLEHRLDGGIHGMAGGWLTLADICRHRIEDLIDRAVDCIGAVTGASGYRAQSVQTGAIPIYLAILAGGFFILWLTLILGVW
ncbi:MAG: proton-conducting transporter membrane subunit [Thermodesulfobacteriota bacterium]